MTLEDEAARDLAIIEAEAADELAVITEHGQKALDTILAESANIAGKTCRKGEGSGGDERK